MTPAYACRVVLRRVTGPIGGAFTPFSHAEVLRRRRDQLRAIVVCVPLASAVPLPAHAPAPPCDCLGQPAPADFVHAPYAPYAFGGLLLPPPAWVAPAPAVAIPAPGGAAIMAVALAALAVWRGRRRS